MGRTGNVHRHVIIWLVHVTVIRIKDARVRLQGDQDKASNVQGLLGRKKVRSSEWKSVVWLVGFERSWLEERCRTCRITKVILIFTNTASGLYPTLTTKCSWACEKSCWLSKIDVCDSDACNCSLVGTRPDIACSNLSQLHSSCPNRQAYVFEAQETTWLQSPGFVKYCWDARTGQNLGATRELSRNQGTSILSAITALIDWPTTQ